MPDMDAIIERVEKQLATDVKREVVVDFGPNELSAMSLVSRATLKYITKPIKPYEARLVSIEDTQGIVKSYQVRFSRR